MSEPIEPHPTSESPAFDDGEPLQFEQAEFTAPGPDRPICTVCKQPIPDDYYEIAGRMMCPRCRFGVEAAFRGVSPIGRFLAASALGLAAAAVGAVIYYAFVKQFNANWALISILVGFMVGTAVRKGSGGRGGRLYQLLAVFLTYTSIAAMLTTLGLDAWREQAAARRAAVAAEKLDKDPAKAGAPDAPAAPPMAAPDFVRIAIVFALLFSLPVMHASGDLISALIYGFALWEAWKLNRRIQLVFNGPFRLGAAGPEPEGVIDGS
jgi:hypothetical protein